MVPQRRPLKKGKWEPLQSSSYSPNQSRSRISGSSFALAAGDAAAIDDPVAVSVLAIGHLIFKVDSLAPAE